MKVHQKRDFKTPESEYTETCGQEYCDRKVLGGLRHRYCFEHKGMSPTDRRREALRLKAIIKKGKEDTFQDW